MMELVMGQDVFCSRRKIGDEIRTNNIDWRPTWIPIMKA
jgi:hypothetical protein